MDIAKLKEESGLINSFNFRDIQMAYLSAVLLCIKQAMTYLNYCYPTKMTGKLFRIIKKFRIIVCMHTKFYIFNYMKPNETADFHIRWSWYNISRMYNTQANEFGGTMYRIHY